MSERFHDIAVTVNGEAGARARRSAQDAGRFPARDLALTGTHVGCEHGLCGACTVRLDGEVVRGCLTLAVQCDGARVDTIEGVSDSGEIADLQTAFEKRNALQCGYCTPGMLLTAQELLRGGGVPSREENPRPHLRQLLPLHRLSGDRRRDRGGGAATRGGASMKIADDNPSALTALDRPNSYIGRSVPRPNLARLTQGRAQFVSDVTLPRMAHVAFVRSPHAHARIKAIDGARGEGDARRHRGGHRRGARQGDHALGRRAHAPQGHQVGAAARRSRSIAPAGRARRSAPWWRAPAPRPRTRCERIGSTTSRSPPSPTPRPRSIRRRR